MTSVPIFTLEGEVYYLAKIALPSGCTLTVTLSNISRADAPARELAVYKTQVTGQVPLPFTLEYPDENGSDYALSARIEHDGRLLWINDTIHPVELTCRSQTGLKIKVIQVGG